MDYNFSEKEMFHLWKNKTFTLLKQQLVQFSRYGAYVVVGLVLGLEGIGEC